MLYAFRHDQGAGELQLFLTSKARSALLNTSPPDRFRQLADVPGVGRQSYARLFQHYFHQDEVSQLPLLSLMSET